MEWNNPDRYGYDAALVINPSSKRQKNAPRMLKNPQYYKTASTHNLHHSQLERIDVNSLSTQGYEIAMRNEQIQQKSRRHASKANKNEQV